MLQKGGLSLELADNMIENCIGIIPLPLGLGTGFRVNGKNFIVPMAIEEPSVIAAASVIAKLISDRAVEGKGFICRSSPQIMIGQIQITSIYDFGLAKVNLMAQKAHILRQANMNCLSMCKRGGGVVDVKARQLASDMMVVELHVDV